MQYNDLIEQQYKRKILCEVKEEEIAREILNKYYQKYPKNIKNFTCRDQLLFEYFMSGDDSKRYLTYLIESYGFDYRASVHNAMFQLLGKKSEIQQYYKIDPISWPGIIDIDVNNKEYLLKTKVGDIRVYKASSSFKNSSSKFIFYKPLVGQCYARTYDFLRQNRNYKAVLSYMPNMFYGGFYHAYLENDESILDISCNAFYIGKDDASNILCGEIIKKLSFDEIEDECILLSKEIGKIKNKDKLNVLTLYHDINNI